MDEPHALHPLPPEPSLAGYPPEHGAWLSWLPWWLPIWVPTLTLAVVLVIAAAISLLVAFGSPLELPGH